MSSHIVKVGSSVVCSYSIDDDVIAELNFLNNKWNLNLQAGKNSKVEVVNFNEKLIDITLRYGQHGQAIHVKENQLSGLILEELEKSHNVHQLCEIPTEKEVDEMMELFTRKNAKC